MFMLFVWVFLPASLLREHCKDTQCFSIADAQLLWHSKLPGLKQQQEEAVHKAEDSSEKDEVTHAAFLKVKKTIVQSPVKAWVSSVFLVEDTKFAYIMRRSGNSPEIMPGDSYVYYPPKYGETRICGT